MFVILLFCLLPSASFAADLQDLVSGSNDFEVEMIEHEHVLERNPSATELAASTFKYARAKERYFVELRKGVSTLIDMTTRKTPKTPEVDKIREIFSGLWRNSREAIGGGHGFDALSHTSSADDTSPEIRFQPWGACRTFFLRRARQNETIRSFRIS
jgi:hypothetical protein